jgi:hypothetical protein
MKKNPLVAAMALFAACNSNPNPSTIDSTKSNQDSTVAIRPIQSPYPIAYSSSFVMDDPKNAETVLAIWKAYDGGNLSTAKDLFADTVEVHLANGLILRGARDSILAGAQGMRNTIKAAVVNVTAVMAVKSTDKNQHWALIWGTEKDTYKNGKVDSTDLQETWLFDNNGKASLFFQYAEKR